MSNGSIKNGMRLAVREHLLAGNKITELESVVIYGVTSLRALLSLLRKEGWVVQSQLTPYAAALRRVNEYAGLQPPKNLPIREIMLTEYWIEQ